MLASSRKFAAEQPSAIEGILRALKRSAADVKADQKAALAVVSGSYGLTDAAYQGYLSYGGIDLTPRYSAETHAFLQDISSFLVQQKKLPQPFDFCRNLDLRYLAKVSPQEVGGTPKCR